MSLHRRDFLKWGAAAGASLIPGAEALAQVPGPRTQETPAQLIDLLLRDPQWQIPPIDTSEAGKKFAELIGAHDRYYSRDPGRGYLHAGFRRLLNNNAEQLKLVLSVAERHEVPRGIVFLALAESHWKPFGENSALAAGYWQFIPATARLYGLHVPTGENRATPRSSESLLTPDAKGKTDERLDAVKSTEAAMRYLKYLKRFFERVQENHNKKPENVNNQITTSENDIWTFAMWAYNRGPGHVRKTFIQTKGNPLLYPITLLAQPNPTNSTKIRDARLESAGYVPKMAAIAAHLARFIRQAPPVQTTPEKTPPKAVPKAAPPAPIAAEPLPEPVQSTERESVEDIEFIEYTVQGGDNLTKIATWISPDPDFVQLRMDQIWEANPQIHDRPRYTIRRDEKLLIPAQTIEVTRRGPAREVLPEFARKYYPGWPASGLNMLRFLNGIRDVNEILPQKDASGRPKKLKVPLQNS